MAELVDDFIKMIPAQLVSYSKKDQFERASLSVSNNIAEGFDRGTTKEMIHFPYIARGSASETCSMALFFQKRPYLNPYKSQIQAIETLARSCSKQLRAWAGHLQKTDHQGAKYQ
ncbi:four helix bundle protein [Verrucomicrobiaceae bacterium N1E253]|uniref:Four helix bundle protein n=1 Tax=Oceaniferula marina TaxID=2748318 RepID=A0A851GK97_9BACT|nr:four helix bundle protein [Oceaniferula marina]